LRLDRALLCLVELCVSLLVLSLMARALVEVSLSLEVTVRSAWLLEVRYLYRVASARLELVAS
jgi:hypothetical protein